MKMRSGSISRAWAVLLIPLALVVLLALPGTSEPSATAPPPTFSEDLAAHGIVFVPLDGTEQAAAYTSVPSAVGVATREYGIDPSHVTDVYFGALTQENRLMDGADATATSSVPAPAVSRPAYAVRIGGLELLALGGPATPERAHEELVVFVDALTGEEIFATTFR